MVPNIIAYSDSVNHVSFSPDGKLLAVGIMDGDIHIYNVEDGKETCTLQMHSDLEVCCYPPFHASLHTDQRYTDSC